MRKAGGVKVQGGGEGGGLREEHRWGGWGRMGGMGRGTGGARRGDLSTHGFTLSNVLHGVKKENKGDIYTMISQLLKALALNSTLSKLGEIFCVCDNSHKLQLFHIRA